MLLLEMCVSRQEIRERDGKIAKKRAEVCADAVDGSETVTNDTPPASSLLIGFDDRIFLHVHSPLN